MYIRAMDDSKMLDKALKRCLGNKTLMASKLGVSRQVVQSWMRKRALPSWRRDTVRNFVTSPKA